MSLAAPNVVIKNGRLWNVVKFNITYDGELLSANDKNSRVKNKNAIRFDIADQLLPIFIKGDFPRFNLDSFTTLEVARVKKGIKCIPILTRKMNASCRLSIKLMRNEHPGQIVHGGDIDNRLKTLFDALRMPENDSVVL